MLSKLKLLLGSQGITHLQCENFVPLRIKVFVDGVCLKSVVAQLQQAEGITLPWEENTDNHQRPMSFTRDPADRAKAGCFHNKWENGRDTEGWVAALPADFLDPHLRIQKVRESHECSILKLSRDPEQGHQNFHSEH